MKFRVNNPAPLSSAIPQKNLPHLASQNVRLVDAGSCSYRRGAPGSLRRSKTLVLPSLDLTKSNGGNWLHELRQEHLRQGARAAAEFLVVKVRKCRGVHTEVGGSFDTLHLAHSCVTGILFLL